ncbi:hypothetical protein Hdeb2414_s0009g00324421 [Helianthus debilis subsp. tardiflorus]
MALRVFLGTACKRLKTLRRWMRMRGVLRVVILTIMVHPSSGKIRYEQGKSCLDINELVYVY